MLPPPLIDLAHFGTTPCHNVIVSFSGGRTSALLAKKMKEDPYWTNKNLLFVFSNTGKEKEQTLVFIDKCDKEFSLNLVWVEAKVNPVLGEGTTYKVVDFISASRNGQPFEDVIKKYGISNKKFPHCTRELKQRPINAFAKSKFGNNYVTAIGIRSDELKRVKRDYAFVYPLVGWGMTVKDVRDFWNNQPFDLEIKDYQGNCDLCWKKSLRKTLTILKEDPSVSEWWNRMEDQYKWLKVEGRQENNDPVHFGRQNHSIQELIKMAEKPFIPVTDAYWKQDFSEQMDEEAPCDCLHSRGNEQEEEI